MMTAFSF